MILRPQSSMPEFNGDEQSVNLPCGNIRFPEMRMDVRRKLQTLKHRGEFWSKGEFGPIKTYSKQCHIFIINI